MCLQHLHNKSYIQYIQQFNRNFRPGEIEKLRVCKWENERKDKMLSKMSPTTHTHKPLKWKWSKRTIYLYTNAKPTRIDNVILIWSFSNSSNSFCRSWEFRILLWVTLAQLSLAVACVCVNGVRGDGFWRNVQTTECRKLPWRKSLFHLSARYTRRSRNHQAIALSSVHYGRPTQCDRQNRSKRKQKNPTLVLSMW